ncbi:VanZ family protein [Povalibacter sp.]|uniref:VanZ family protein n=1 Tax=Povalibacter sp. TaxID=1962978 RepID=UPI002F3E8684
MLQLRYGRWWLAIGWLLVLAVMVVCLMPAQELPKTGMSDKSEHLIAFCGLMLWFAGLSPRSSYLRIAGALFALAVGIEIAQSQMHLGRYGDVWDVVADSIGIATGLGLAYAGLGRWAQWFDGWAGGRELKRAD